MRKRDKGRKLINETPQTFIQLVPGNSNAKELLSCHSLFHQWAQEIRSNSPNVEIGEHRWTLPWIIAGHDAVVRRITQLKPKWQHDSPIEGEATEAAKPVMLETSAVEVLGDGKLRVRSSILNERLVAGLRADLADAFQGADPMAPGATSYHLVLIPAKQWERHSQNKLSAAISAYKAEIGAASMDPWLHRRIMAGRGLIESAMGGIANGFEAEAYACRVAAAVLSGLDLQKVVAADAVQNADAYTSEMAEAAMEIAIKALEPDMTEEEILPILDRSLAAARREAGPMTLWQAIDLAKEIGLRVAENLKAGKRN